MEGRSLGRIAALLLAPMLVAPFPEVAEAQSVETKQARKSKAKKATLSREEAEKRYQQAQALEKQGDQKGALTAYLAAGEAGHGFAQKRLGEIYEKGNSAVKRDYDTALRWYEKARAQGIEVPKPIVHQVVPR